MKCIFFLFVCLLMMLSGCSEEQMVQPPDNTSAILPLATGNHWVGRLSMKNSALASQVEIGFDTLAIVEQAMIGEELWYRSNTGQWYINRKDGLWAKNIQGHIYLEAKYPASLHDSFDMDTVYRDSVRIEMVEIIDTVVIRIPEQDYDTILYQHRTEQRKIAIKDSIVTYRWVAGVSEDAYAPVGAVSSYEYQVLQYSSLAGNTLLLERYWYAPGRGIIRRETLIPGNPNFNWRVWELVAIELQ